MKLLSLNEMDAVVDAEPTIAANLKLGSRGGGPSDRLNFDWTDTKKYLSTHCSGKNSCPDGNFSFDCTHFVCHALNKGNVFIADPAAYCQRAMGVNAAELYKSFRNSVELYTNVREVDGWTATREGDFAFVPS